MDIYDVSGDFTSEGSFAEKVDRLILGRFRDWVYWDEAGEWYFSPYYNDTWILSSLSFGVTVMLGYFAGRIIKQGREDGRRVVRTLLLTGYYWSEWGAMALADAYYKNTMDLQHEFIIRRILFLADEAILLLDRL